MAPSSAATRKTRTRSEDSGDMDRPSSPDYGYESSPEPVSRPSQEESVRQPQRLEVNHGPRKHKTAINRDNQDQSTALRSYEGGGDLEHTSLSGEISRTGEPSTEEIIRSDENESHQVAKNDDSGLKLRLDLNLDIEVELKAKIYGDITLSLLYVLSSW